MATFTVRFASPGLPAVTSGGIVITPPPGVFGAYDELEALFEDADIYQYNAANLTVNPLNEAVPLGAGANSYGWAAQGGNRTDSGAPYRAPVVVSDPQRGQVLSWPFLTGDAGGGAPIRVSGIGPFWSDQGTVLSVTSMTRSGQVASVTTSAAHGYAVGTVVRFDGATNSSGWNARAIVATVPTSTTFTYLLASYETYPTPATGTITVRSLRVPTKLGIGYRVKLGANWTNNGNSGTKLVFTRSPIADAQRDRTSLSDTAGQNHLLGLSSTPYPDLMMPSYHLQETTFANLYGTHGFARDVWHSVQVYLESNTGTTANGKLRIWVTPEGGAKELWYSSDTVLYHVGGSAHGWGSLFFDPTYGGGFNAVPADQDFRLDDFLVASSAVTAPTIALQPLRLASGSGTTQMSSGVLFRQGQVQPAALAQCGLWRNGVEVACNLTALQGAYYDGSLVGALLQYQTTESLTKDDTATGASPGAATYEFRFTGSSVARTSQQAGWIKDVPDGVWRMPPSHFTAPVAGMLGKFIPLADVPSGSLWRTVDTRYKQAADYRWETLGETTTGTGSTMTPIEYANSFYDQPRQRLQYWARGGQSKDLERGLLQAAVTRNYYAGGWQQWHRQSVGTMPVAYWLTGVSSYRDRTLAMASSCFSGAFPPPSDPGYDDGRITGRNIGWALCCWLLGYTSTTFQGGYTAAQWMDGLATLQMARQDTNAVGAFMEYGSETRGENQQFQSTFMAGIRTYYTSLYTMFRGTGQVAGCVSSIVDCGTWTRNAWWSAYQAYYYHYPLTPNGDAGVGDEMRGLGLLALVPELLAYGYGGGISTDHITAALTMHNTESAQGGGGTIYFFSSPDWSRKQYVECHYAYALTMALSQSTGVL